MTGRPLAESAPEVVDTAERDALQALSRGECGDPFAWLGPHEVKGGWCVRTLFPGALQVILEDANGRLIAESRRTAFEGLFVAWLTARPVHYVLRIAWPESEQVMPDAYRHGELLSDDALVAFRDGVLSRPEETLGSHPLALDGEPGVRFAVWAPSASRVSVVGAFNGWDGRRHPMRLRHGYGIWEIFVPGLMPGEAYKFEILDRAHRLLPLKADPFALRMEHPPASASLVPEPWNYRWNDDAWMSGRSSLPHPERALAIYEVHPTSWQYDETGGPLDWDDLSDRLIRYVAALGFTHIELLPISEYPFGGSWGYQPLGLYAPTARLGAPDGFARFVDACHDAGIGVILDWVGAHFPNDAHGLVQFDGTALYEHADPREGVHKDWDTLIYNFGHPSVRNLLIGSALAWLRRYHVDGLRVDAVASMLYRDYSRAHGEWIPNVHGGRENLEAIAFLRELNEAVARDAPGTLMIAEESTAWPGVTAPVGEGGLGFTYKWNMGWMHDSLAYVKRGAIHRAHHHSELTFASVYAYAERFILPLSHDEVVHGKGSLLSRMPGDRWQRFATLRAYFGFMWAHPGKKLLFMGDEFAQCREWNHDRPLDWELVREPDHQGVQRLVADLNRLLLAEPAMHQQDHLSAGFGWVIADDNAHSVYAFLRYGAAGHRPVLAVCNFIPEPRYDYDVGVPLAGRWRELCNTDSAHYGGSNVGNGGVLDTETRPRHGHGQVLRMTLPPLATVLLGLENP